MSSSDKDFDWKELIKTVTPISSSHQNEKPEKKKKEILIQHRINPPLSKSYQKTQDLVKGELFSLDKKTAQKFSKGKMTIESQLDLHGLTQEQAVEKLNAFLEKAILQQKRMLLIITGKGSVNTGSGILRQKLIDWLNASIFKPYILSVTHAIPSHGGLGAFYVLLKRNRERKN